VAQARARVLPSVDFQELAFAAAEAPRFAADAATKMRKPWLFPPKSGRRAEVHQSERNPASATYVEEDGDSARWWWASVHQVYAYYATEKPFSPIGFGACSVSEQSVSASGRPLGRGAGHGQRPGTAS